MTSRLVHRGPRENHSERQSNGLFGGHSGVAQGVTRADWVVYFKIQARCRHLTATVTFSVIISHQSKRQNETGNSMLLKKVAKTLGKPDKYFSMTKLPVFRCYFLPLLSFPEFCG